MLCLLCYCTTIQYTADSEKLRTFSLFSESEALNSAAAASQRNPEKSGLIGYYLFGPNEPWSDMCSLSLRSLANAKSSSSRSRTRAEPEKRARARDLSLETHLTTDLLRDRSLTTLTKFCPLFTYPKLTLVKEFPYLLLIGKHWYTTGNISSTTYLPSLVNVIKERFLKVLW